MVANKTVPMVQANLGTLSSGQGSVANWESLEVDEDAYSTVERSELKRELDLRLSHELFTFSPSIGSLPKIGHDEGWSGVPRPDPRHHLGGEVFGGHEVFVLDTRDSHGLDGLWRPDGLEVKTYKLNIRLRVVYMS